VKGLHWNSLGKCLPEDRLLEDAKNEKWIDNDCVEELQEWEKDINYPQTVNLVRFHSASQVNFYQLL